MKRHRIACEEAWESVSPLSRWQGVAVVIAETVGMGVVIAEAFRVGVEALVVKRSLGAGSAGTGGVRRVDLGCADADGVRDVTAAPEQFECLPKREGCQLGGRC